MAALRRLRPVRRLSVRAGSSTGPARLDAGRYLEGWRAVPLTQVDSWIAKEVAEVRGRGVTWKAMK
jgi:hypothetical protein